MCYTRVCVCVLGVDDVLTYMFLFISGDMFAPFFTANDVYDTKFYTYNLGGHPLENAVTCL